MPVGSARSVDEDLQCGSEPARKRDEAARLRDESATWRDEVAELRDEVADLRGGGTLAGHRHRR